MIICAMHFGSSKFAEVLGYSPKNKLRSLNKGWVKIGWKKTQNLVLNVHSLYAKLASKQKELSAQIANMKIFVLCVSENGMAQIVVEIKRVVSLSNISQVALGTKSLMSRIEQLVFFLTTWHLSTEPAPIAALFLSTWKLASIWTVLFVDVCSVGYVWALQKMAIMIVDLTAIIVERLPKLKNYDWIQHK